MAHAHPKPAPKLDATKVPPPPAARNADERREHAIDEAIDESFPASDPPAISSPGNAAALKKGVQSGRRTGEPKRK